MTSVLDVPSGVQQPRVELIPDYATSAGQEAIELAAMAGLDLDPWQQYVLAHSLGETSAGQWAAFEIGVAVPRQNGKGALLEARELAGLFLLDEELIIHSAHLFDTSLEHFRRLEARIQDTPDLHRRVKDRGGYIHSHGAEGITLKSGARISFRTRTRGGGRGFSADCVILDEAMYISEATMGALMPTLSARETRQVWYTGSAVDQMIHADGYVFSRVRHRGVKGEDPSLAYFEWSLDADDPQAVEAQQSLDPECWAQANPALGIRIEPSHVANEQRAMDARTFAVERLNVGDWPSPDGSSSVIDLELWDSLHDADSKLVGEVAFAFDVAPNRSWSTISVAGKRADGLWHVEVVDHKMGTAWIVPRIVELAAAHDHVAVGCDAVAPAGSLLHDLAEAGVEITTFSAAEHAQACGAFFDTVEQKTLRHLGTDDIRAAIRGATKRPLGDSWGWSRSKSSVDITPLVSTTLALRLAATATNPEPPLAVAFA